MNLNYGTIKCSSLGFTQSSSLSLTGCTQSTLSFNTNILSQGLIWFAFNVQNYFSVRNDIKVSVSVSGPSPSNYKLGSGETTVSLNANKQSLTITNTETTFGVQTSFNII